MFPSLSVNHALRPLASALKPTPEDARMPVGGAVVECADSTGQTLSNAIATAPPPPRQRVARP